MINNDKHIDENSLEKYTYNPEFFSLSEITEFQDHLAGCALCHKKYEFFKEADKILQNKLNSPALQRDIEFAHSLLEKKDSNLLPFRAIQKSESGHTFGEYKELVPVKPRLPVRFFQFVRYHPFVSGASVTALAGMFFLVTQLFRPITDTNPTSAELKNSKLTVHNAKSEIIWEKSFDYAPNISGSNSWQTFNQPNQSILIADINGDIKREVIVPYFKSFNSEFVDALVCFSDDGTIIWNYSCRTSIQFGSKDFIKNSRLTIASIFVLTDSTTGKKRLFSLEGDISYFPNALSELDVKNGNVLQTYWNAGGLGKYLIMDIDRDGQNDIIIQCFNNPFKQVGLIVLDINRLSGVGPLRGDYLPASIPSAAEKYYVLFPMTEIAKKYNQYGYNGGDLLFYGSDNSFTATTEEAKNFKGIHYIFGTDMKILSVLGDDVYNIAHRKLEKEGKTSERIGPDYWENLKNSLLYWDGEKFVNHHTMNLTYSKQLKLP